MLTESGIEKKLYDTPQMFTHHLRRKDYLNAALCVDWAQRVAMFVGLDESKKAELFGDRQPDEPVEGLIKEGRYLKACEWCIIHGYATTRRTYQQVQKMR